MALKSYLIDDSLLRMYMSPKHEVKKDGKTVMYRLIQGDSELELKKQPENADTRTIYFGQKIFTTDDATEQQFIESKPYYGTKIKHYDPLAESTKRVADKKKTVNLLKEVVGFDDDKIRTVGYRLFGRTALEYMKEGNLNALHDELIDYAGENPELMQLKIDDKENAEALYAAFLVASGVLEVSIDDREVVWGDNQSRVFSVPNGVSALDGLVEFFKTSEGREVKKEASLRVEKKAGENASKKVDADDEKEDETPARKAGRPAVNK